jgi:hypothetical protein
VKTQGDTVTEEKGLFPLFFHDVSLWLLVKCKSMALLYVLLTPALWCVCGWCAEVVGVAGLVARGAKVGMVINEEMVARYDNQSKHENDRDMHRINGSRSHMHTIGTCLEGRRPLTPLPVMCSAFLPCGDCTWCEGTWWRGSGMWRGGDTPCDPSSRRPSGTTHTCPAWWLILGITPPRTLENHSIQPFPPNLTSTSTFPPPDLPPPIVSPFLVVRWREEEGVNSIAASEVVDQGNNGYIYVRGVVRPQDCRLLS